MHCSSQSLNSESLCGITVQALAPHKLQIDTLKFTMVVAFEKDVLFVCAKILKTPISKKYTMNLAEQT